MINKMRKMFFWATAAVLGVFASGCDKSTETLGTPSVEISDVTVDGFTFTWSSVSGASGYEYSVTESEKLVKEGTTVQPESVSVTGLQMATSYKVNVRALGTGSYSNSEYATEAVQTLDNVVHFNDAVLERRLLAMTEPKVDADGDGKITLEEAAAVKELKLGFEEKPETDADCVTDITGLEKFTALEYLSLKYNKVSDASPVEGLSSLQTLILGENPITSLNLESLGNLVDLRLYGTDISEIDLSKTPKLEYLYLQRTKVTAVDLTVLPELEQALVNDCSQLGELKVAGLQKLTRLDAVKGNLSAFEISDCPELMELHLNSNKIASVKLTNLPKLMRLNLYDNKLTALDVSKLPFLMWLFVYDNQLTILDLSANTMLRNLHASNNPLTEVDLSHNENVMTVELENMSKMKVLNLKNGGYYDDWDNEYSIVTGNTALEKVITDAGAEYEAVKKMFASNPKVQVVTE